LEEGNSLQISFERFKSPAGVGVIPVAVQDLDSKEVLLIAHANQEALDYALKHRIATFWSTSRNELWIKGQTSGNELELIEVRVNCEQNSLLYLVRPKRGGACHTKDEQGNYRKSCFYRRIADSKLQMILVVKEKVAEAH